MKRLLLIVVLCCAGSATAQHVQPHAPASAFQPPGRSISFSIVLPLNKARWTTRDGTLSRRAVLEMVAVTLTGAGHLAFSALDASYVFIPVASLGWGTYVIHRARQDPGFLRRAGFTRRGLGPAFRDASFVAVGALGLMAGIGLHRGALVLDRDMVPLLALYPV